MERLDLVVSVSDAAEIVNFPDNDNRSLLYHAYQQCAIDCAARLLDVAGLNNPFNADDQDRFLNWFRSEHRPDLITKFKQLPIRSSGSGQSSAIRRSART
jgi:hypothetical protein